jgi:tRNA (mo5U34)-methyltransferase
MSDACEAVASNPLWYHTIEVAPGLLTPGWFDLRPILDRMPWPDVRGKRCLDIGTYDGFLAFELERRGASEVLATDIADHELWDWPPHMRERGVDHLRALAGPRKGLGFEIARRLLGSSVQLAELSAYDLSPERIGEFDVVVCGSLLLHLRDPLRALETIRSVCRGQLLCTNEVDLALSLLHRRGAVARLDGIAYCRWWVPSSGGHRRMLEATGFTIEGESGLYSVPFGPSHPTPSRTGRGRIRSLARRAVTGNDGVPHHAILARSTA